jgi:hypothetical protein
MNLDVSWIWAGCQLEFELVFANLATFLRVSEYV